jgi:tRNA modification GTPase
VKNKADLIRRRAGSSIAGRGSQRNVSGSSARPLPGKTQAEQHQSNESEFIKSILNSDQIFIVSAASGEGVDSLLGDMTSYASDLFGSEPALVSRQRQRRALSQVEAALGRALAQGLTDREDIVAEELRTAATALGRLTGQIDVEDVLDAIFEDFCIGK